jgi:hypothetical protein
MIHRPSSIKIFIQRKIKSISIEFYRIIMIVIAFTEIEIITIVPTYWIISFDKIYSIVLLFGRLELVGSYLLKRLKVCFGNRIFCYGLLGLGFNDSFNFGYFFIVWIYMPWITFTPIYYFRIYLTLLLNTFVFAFFCSIY